MGNRIHCVIYVISFTILILTGCSRDEMQSENGDNLKQLELESDLSGIYESAVFDSRRPAEDVTRDAGRKPAEVMKFFEIKPGQRVIDFNSGIGYFTRIISVIVGSGGSVVAHNSGPRMNANFINDEFKSKLLEQYSSYGNVEVNYEDVESMSYLDNSVDVVFLSLAFHHWHHSDDSGESISPISLERMANVMRMLKSGGVFAIIDHEAAEGMSRQESDAIHRIPRATAIADIIMAGFEFVAESDIHADHPEDDLTIRWTRDPRDATRRIVQLYRKPESIGLVSE